MSYTYEDIDNEYDLKRFVQGLNELPMHHRSMIFSEVFRARLIEMYKTGYPRNSRESYQFCKFPVGSFTVYATIKINLDLQELKPLQQSGVYEDIYFHIALEDDRGISQNPQ